MALVTSKAAEASQVGCKQLNPTWASITQIGFVKMLTACKISSQIAFHLPRRIQLTRHRESTCWLSQMLCSTTRHQGRLQVSHTLSRLRDLLHVILLTTSGLVDAPQALKASHRWDRSISSNNLLTQPLVKLSRRSHRILRFNKLVQAQFG